MFKVLHASTSEELQTKINAAAGEGYTLVVGFTSTVQRGGCLHHTVILKRA